MATTPDTPQLSSQRQTIKAMAGVGLTDQEIAITQEMPLAELRSNFARELLSGRIEAKANVAKTVYTAATDKTNPNVGLAMSMLRNRSQWDSGGDSSNETVSSIPPRTEWMTAVMRRRSSGFGPEVLDIDEHDMEAEEGTPANEQPAEEAPKRRRVVEE